MHVLALLLALWGTPASAPPPATGTVSAAEVLHAWDARREAAWMASSPALLGSLYAGRSAARDADVALLRDYRAHHLVVRRLRTQVFALTVLHRDATRLRLRVLDRVAGGEVYDGRDSRPLGTTAPTARVVDLGVVDGRWRVRSVHPVSDSGRAPRRAPPARPGR